MTTKRTTLAADGIRCRTCNASPAERRDHVDPRALAYECNRCLMGFGPGAPHSPQEPREPGAAIPPGTPLEGPDSGPDIPATSNTILRYGRAGKPGRPRVPAAEQRRKARERARTYRARKQGNNPQEEPVHV